MSASPAPSTASLTVKAGDDTAEIYLINGEFDLIARAAGSLTTELTPGIYKVRVRTGFDIEEKHVLLQPGDRIQLDFKPLAFSAPAPISDTARTHEYHEAAAATESKNVHASIGTGSSIFVFARDWSAPEQLKSTVNPAQGLSLCKMTGESLLQLEEQARFSSGPGLDPWAACNVQVDPGDYCLKLAFTSGIEIAQTIVACPNWQTQIFLLQHTYNESGNPRRADVDNASIIMAPLGAGFDPRNPQLRLTEIARQGLANRRKVLSSEIGQLTQAKFDNPMLGIYAAHLMLLSEKFDGNLLATMVSNLRMLTGGTHPDVEAIALRMTSLVQTNEAPTRAISASPSYVFQVPPMLCRSWALIVAASVSRPELVPSGSLCASIAEVLWGGEPWLQWRADQAAWQHASEQYKRSLRSMLRPREALAAMLATPSSESPFGFVNEIRKRTGAVPRIEDHGDWLEIGGIRLPKRTSPTATTSGSGSKSEAVAKPEQPPQAAPEHLAQILFETHPRPNLDTLVDRLGMPRSRVEQMLKDEESGESDVFRG